MGSTLSATFSSGLSKESNIQVLLLLLYNVFVGLRCDPKPHRVY